MSTEDTLDTIGHVLHDYQTSTDAMRWKPEPAPRPVPAGRVFFAPIGTPPNGDQWREIGAAASFEYSPTQLADNVAIVVRQWTTAMSQLRVTFRTTAQQISALMKLFAPQMEQIIAAQQAERQRNMHVAYRRRSLARKRRNRR